MEPGCFLVWNVRGLNSRAKRDSVKSVVVSLKPAVVCLQETKLDYVSDFNILTILGSGFSNFVFNPAHESRGGILIAWRDGSFVSAASVDPQILQPLPDKSPFLITQILLGLCAPP
jgi:exonuclease III